MNLHTDQFVGTDYRGIDELINKFVHLSSNNRDTDELTNRSVHLRSDNRDTDELTNRSIHLSSDNKDADELTNRLVHLTQSSKSRLIGNKLTNISVNFRVEKDKLTNRPVQSL
jgi:hypothetical protein